MKTINLKRGEYEITLLTTEEYYNHRDNIPRFSGCWWLRSPGVNDYFAACVFGDGFVLETGDSVSGYKLGVRPALKSKNLNFSIGEKFVALGNRWIMIDENFAISESVVAARRYDLKSNNWETSELKAWLENWAKEAET